MSFNYTSDLPLSSNNPIFNLLDCYLDGYDEGNYPASAYVDTYSRDQFLLDFFGNEGNYLNSDRYYLSGSECSVVPSEEVITLSIAEGDNQFTPFINSTDYTLQKALSSSEFLNGTAGNDLTDSDIIWQFTEDCLEGAYLKQSNSEFLQKTACIKLFPDYNEFKFPYPDRGTSGFGLEWTGKGINNCFLSPYTNPELKAVTEQIEGLYWSDVNTLSSVESIPLIETTLKYDENNLSSSPHPSKNIFYADQIKTKPTKDGTTGEKVAWFYDFDHTELPISCGENLIHYPLFLVEDNSNFNIDVDQVEDIPLSSLDVLCNMTGAKAGLSVDDADHIYKLNGECNGIIEGAWLSGCPFQSEQHIFLSASIDDIINNSAFYVDEGDIILSSYFYLSGEEFTYIDCGEKILSSTDPEEKNIKYTLLSDFPYDDDYNYFLELDDSSDDGLYGFTIDAESGNDEKPDDQFYYTLSSDGYNNLYVYDERGNVNNIDVTDLYDYIKIKKHCVGSVAKQNTFSAVFDSNSIGYFHWEFPDVLASNVINGMGHDPHCDYLSIDDYDDIINPSTNDEGNQWKKCNCKSVYYSPIGNNLGRFDDYINFSDFIFEDTSEDFNISEWRDSNGNDYKTSPHFGIYVVDNTQNATEHAQHDGVAFGSTGSWQTYSGADFELIEGKKYGYKRADFGGCATQKPPCMIFNNKACYDGCQDGRPNPVWIGMTQVSNGEWASTGEFSNMVLEANDYYNYNRQDSVSYQAILSGENCVTRRTSLPSFNLNIPFENALPYWAESPTLGGLNYGIEASESDSYLLSTQPKPSQMVLSNDLYFQYYRNNSQPLIWNQPLNFTVDFEIPNKWKKIDFSFVNPPLLRKIVGCGGCDMVFGDSPANSCFLSQDNCDAYIASISATDIDSDMVIRNSLNCSDETLIYYKAQESYEINQIFDTSTSTGGILSGDYMTATHPWRNLDNETNKIYMDERSGRLVTEDEIGLFKPCNVGVNKMVCQEEYELQDIDC